MNHGLETRGPTPISGALVGLLQDKVSALSTLSPRPSPETGEEELYGSVRLYAGTKQSMVGNPPARFSRENPALSYCLFSISVMLFKRGAKPQAAALAGEEIFPIQSQQLCFHG